jgi:heme/copper-type cytochrome/quinol oxidase subunit 3
MNKLLKLIHFLSIILFLGSIFTYILISVLAEDAKLVELAFGRRIISSGTRFLTIPSLWTLVLSGLFMGYQKYGLKNNFTKIKILIGFLILLNAYFFVGPAVFEATHIAETSIVSGILSERYLPAYWKESAFGTLNVIMALIAITISIWRKN